MRRSESTSPKYWLDLEFVWGLFTRSHRGGVTYGFETALTREEVVT